MVSHYDEKCCLGYPSWMQYITDSGTWKSVDASFVDCGKLETSFRVACSI